jgi:hypothetical protein
MKKWIREELAACDLGDKRLEKRYRTLLERMGSKPSLSIPAACRGCAEVEAAYRFFDNEKVTPAKVLSPHRAASVERLRQEKGTMRPHGLGY